MGVGLVTHSQLLGGVICEPMACGMCMCICVCCVLCGWFDDVGCEDDFHSKTLYAVSTNRPAHARWPDRHAKRLRPPRPRAHMAMAARKGNTQAAASMPLCWLECCVPPMAHSTNKGTNTQHTPPSSRYLARSCVHARGMMCGITLHPSCMHVWQHTGHICPAKPSTAQ